MFGSKASENLTQKRESVDATGVKEREVAKDAAPAKPRKGEVVFYYCCFN